MKTLIGKTKFLSMLFENSFWFALGGPSAWDNENDPDSPVNTATNITDPFIFIKVLIPKMCKIDQDGELLYGSIKLKEIAEENWYTEFPDHIYCEISIDDSIITVGTKWRQTGFFINTQRTETVPSTQTILTPSLNEVLDYGIMLSYENHTVKELQAGETRKVVGLIEI